MKSGSSTQKKKTVKKEDLSSEFPIVAIGASAGGLEAVGSLLQYLPVDTGMAFIYVQHLNPDYKSMLTELLSKRTKMKVQEVVNMVKLQPNNFYVVPPDKEMEVIDGRIKLIARKKVRGSYLPIDAFFISLAEKHKESVIGIILSGSASDGAKGLRAIKSEGGLTFAQDDSAKFTSMPKSAMAEGAVDFVLSPKEIAREIDRISKSKYVHRDEVRKGYENEIDNNSPELKNIFGMLLNTTGVDFSRYKMNTVKRRILRRMLLYKLNNLKEYARMLAKKEEEIDILYQDLLINVTSFFRDSEAHRYLKSTLFPRLLKSKAKGEPLRIWVPACSTGEEAYSLAMILLELQNEKAGSVPIQIFATDLSEHAIQKARVGEYSASDVEAVSPKRLQRFYTKINGNYRVAKIVRDMCVFAPHNIMRDPPFSRIDFVSCCNLLIYLEAAAQKAAIATFHYALNNGGYLMLGKSESIGSAANLFTTQNSKFKVYQRKAVLGQRVAPELPFRFTAGPKKEIAKAAPRPTSTADLDTEIDALLLAHYVPASVVINQDMEIVQFRGSTSLYLQHAPGKASLNILKMTWPELTYELRNIIQKAFKGKQPVRRTGIESKAGTVHRLINIEAVPVRKEEDQPLLLIIFTESEHTDAANLKLKPGKGNSILKDRRIKKLESELAAAYANVRTLTEEHEAAFEELQSANEEIVSSNEELQSVNEELETSQEEIESTNEELVTTNQELITRNDLLTEAYDYTDSIVSTIHEPLVVLDEHLRVKSANKAFYRKFKAHEEDTEGRTLFQLGNGQWDVPRLREMLEDIITNNYPLRDFQVKHTFPGIGEKNMLLNAQRIVQKSHREHLVLLAIADITDTTLTLLQEHNLELTKAVEEQTGELKKANELLEQKNGQLESMNNELSSFAYISSHDLQEPLRKIQTFSSRLAEREGANLTEEGKDYFKRMQDAARRMQLLIDDLLAYSRTSTSERKFINTDLNKIIKEVKNDLKEVIFEKQATVENSKLPELPVIPFQFRQMMSNLISNSLKFSVSGRPPHIIIRNEIIKGSELNGKGLSPENNYCHISVSDNGIGFDPEFSTRIFEVFQRLHGKSEYAGTGIGLAIVKKIVENHHGVITATGKPGEGATFDIYIPTGI